MPLPSTVVQDLKNAHAKLDQLITRKYIPNGIKVDLAGPFDTVTFERVKAGAWGAKAFVEQVYVANVTDAEKDASLEEKMVAEGDRQNYESVLRDKGYYEPMDPKLRQAGYKEAKLGKKQRRQHEHNLFFCDFVNGFNVQRDLFVAKYRSETYVVPPMLGKVWKNAWSEDYTPSADIEPVIRAVR